jgi:hypothetical protein
MLVGSCCIIIRESERGWRCPKLQQIPHTLVTSDTRPIVKDKSQGKKNHGYQRRSEEKKRRHENEQSAYAKPIQRRGEPRTESDEDFVGSLIQILGFYIELLQEIGEAAHGEDASQRATDPRNKYIAVNETRCDPGAEAKWTGEEFADGAA